MNEFTEDILIPLECESNIFNRGYKIKPPLYTHEVMEGRRKGEMERGIIQPWGKWRDSDTEYIRGPLLRVLCTSSHLLHHNLVRRYWFCFKRKPN